MANSQQRRGVVVVNTPAPNVVVRNQYGTANNNNNNVQYSNNTPLPAHFQRPSSSASPAAAPASLSVNDNINAPPAANAFSIAPPPFESGEKMPLLAQVHQI